MVCGTWRWAIIAQSEVDVSVRNQTDLHVSSAQSSPCKPASITSKVNPDLDVRVLPSCGETVDSHKATNNILPYFTSVLELIFYPVFKTTYTIKCFVSSSSALCR